MSTPTALERLKKSVSMEPRRKAVTLPDGSEFEFYARPITLAQHTRARKAAGSPDETAFALVLLVMVATDQDGNKLFQQGELAELRNDLPGNVINRILLQLLKEEEEGEEEDEDSDPKGSSGSSKKTVS